MHQQPKVIILHILNYVDKITQIRTVSAVCKYWYQLVKSESISGRCESFSDFIIGDMIHHYPKYEQYLQTGKINTEWSDLKIYDIVANICRYIASPYLSKIFISYQYIKKDIILSIFCEILDDHLDLFIFLYQYPLPIFYDIYNYCNYENLISNNHTKIIDYLIIKDNSFRSKFIDYLHPYGIRGCSFETFKYLCQNFIPKNKLEIYISDLCYVNDIREVKYLYDIGADFDSDYSFNLNFAIDGVRHTKSYECVIFLLQIGKANHLNRINDELRLIIERCNLNMIKIFESAGIDLHFQNDILFELAISHNQYLIMKFLYLSGAKINDHILKLAIECNYPNIITYLTDNYTKAAVSKPTAPRRATYSEVCRGKLNKY